MAYCVYCGSGGADRFCTSCGKEQPSTVTKARKRRQIKFTRKGLAITGALLLVLGLGIQQAVTRLVLPYSGPLTIEISNNASGNEASSVIYQVLVNDSRVTFPQRGTTGTEDAEWESDQIVEVQLTSKLMGEKDLTLSFDPKSIKPFGLDPGKPLRVEITFGETAVVAKLQVEDGSVASGWKDIFQDSTNRVNLKAEIDKCVSANDESTEELVAYAEGAFASYLSAVERARLDGERDLYYYEWADRASSLVSYLQQEIDSAPKYEGTLGAKEWSSFKGAFEDSKFAWEYLADVSEREADSEWDSAWEAIYDAEANLELTANAFVRVGSNTYEGCLATLYK